MRIGLLAGSGSLPRQVHDALLNEGHEVVPVMLGDAQPILPDATICPLDRPGRLIRHLRAKGATKLIMIGRLERPIVSTLRPDLKGWRILPKIIKGLRQGDDGLLRAVAQIFEDEGFEIINPLAYVPNLSLAAGSFGVPHVAHLEDINRGWALLDDLSSHDIGQACVVRAGNVIAIEAAEGTDAMLERVADLSDGRSGRQRQPSGVLVKKPKSAQDMRFDLPAIGPRTMELVAQAGLAGICVAADGFVLAEPEASKKAVAEYDLFLLIRDHS
ncbi:MAG TPA: DUF1009 domain-containing protein [Alphaproteobacteria bacterium]|nr:DUF1009 domain-containing protein [Alphaproteobacteria bacterium]|tara:strand:- start:2808 stop:3623 length:816 start_codon:yes stop_codon:yes gene_type:complete